MLSETDQLKQLDEILGEDDLESFSSDEENTL